MIKGSHHTEATRLLLRNARIGVIPWNKGKKLPPMSEEVKLKLRTYARYNHPNLGKHHSEATKEKLRCALIGRVPWNKGKKGTPWTEEHKLKHSIDMKIKMKGFVPWAVGKNKKDYPQLARDANRLRLQRLNQVFPFKDTKIERLIQDELSSREYAYYCHYPIKGQPDIAFPDQKIAIFADGDYFHANPKRYKATDIIRGKWKQITAKDIWEKDKEITQYLQSQGWLILRYWEHEIKANPEAVVDEIEDCLMMKMMG